MQYVCIHCGHGDDIQPFVDGRKNKYKCNYCGRIEDRVKGAQGDFEIVVTVDGKIQHRSAVVVIVQNGCVLFLTRRNAPYGVFFPGGHVTYEDNGDSRIAGVREVREETGIIIRPEDLELLVIFPLQHVECHASPDIEVMDIYVVFLPDGPFVPVAIGEEHSSFHWSARNEFHLLDLSKSAQEAIETITPSLDDLWRKRYQNETE